MKHPLRSVPAIAFVALITACSTRAQDLSSAAQILVEAEFIAFEKGDIATLADKPGVVSTADLMKLRADGKGVLRYAPQVATLSGQQAAVKAVTEYNYPTGLTLSASTNVALSQLGMIMCSSGMETREAGTVLTILPELAADGQTIKLTFQAETVNDVEWKNFGDTTGAGAAPAGGRQLQPAMSFAQPFFHTHYISTSIMLKDGETKVLGGGIRSAKETSLVYIFVTATVVKD